MTKECVSFLFVCLLCTVRCCSPNCDDEVSLLQVLLHKRDRAVELSPTSKLAPTFNEIRCGYDEQTCADIAMVFGLQVGGSGYEFAGKNYTATGCYAYSGGEMAGQAFYGYLEDGGNVQQESQLTHVKSPRYRLVGSHSCQDTDLAASMGGAKGEMATTAAVSDASSEKESDSKWQTAKKPLSRWGGVTGKESFEVDKAHEVSSMDRYPAIYGEMKDLLAGESEQSNMANESKSTSASTQKSPSKLNLLSFGCADGSEVRTLRSYFADARIDGFDDDAAAIAKNSANNTDPSIQYFSELSPLVAQSYDAVLALSALCQDSLTDHMPYTKFSNTMTLIDGLVKPGGYIVLYNADYPFSSYHGHQRYKNMATNCDLGKSAMVLAADQKGSHSQNPEFIHERGKCSFVGDHCIESGWRWKFDAVGQQVQEAGKGLMSFGCTFPGTFFKKVTLKP